MEQGQQSSLARPRGRSGGRTVVLSESSANVDKESAEFLASTSIRNSSVAVKKSTGANANNADDADCDNSSMCIDSALTGGAVAAPRAKLSTEKRKEIETNIDKLLVHAATCDDDSSCCSTCCAKWADLKQHAISCSADTGVCSRCRMYWMAIRVHCRRCNDRQCKVPECAQE